jgi:hypothetical protein
MMDHKAYKELEARLVAAVQEGLCADDVSRFILGPILARRQEIYAVLESVDVGVVNMPHYTIEAVRAELRLLRSIEDGVKTAIQRGIEAKDSLKNLDQSREIQPSRLRF